MSDDFPGEAQYYYEEYLQGGDEHDVRGLPGDAKLYLKDGIALCVTNPGKVSTALTISAVLSDRRFDFSEAYVIAVGCAGAARDYGVFGDVYVISAAADYDLGHHHQRIVEVYGVPFLQNCTRLGIVEDRFELRVFRKPCHSNLLCLALLEMPTWFWAFVFSKGHRCACPVTTEKLTREHGGRVAHPVRGPMPRRGMLVQVDGNGEPYDPGEGVKVNLFIDAWTEEMHVERYSKRYRCVLCGVREHEKTELVSNQKELQDLLKKMRE